MIFGCVENPIFVVYLVLISAPEKKADICDLWMCEKKPIFDLSGMNICTREKVDICDL